MIDHTPDERLGLLLDELGPADPPSGFAREVMSRIDGEGHRVTGGIIPFSRGGIAMTKNAMWGLAATAAAALIVFGVRGFPPVGRGTEGTIGAAKRYQAQQLSDKDVVLADTSAQQFLQSDTFERLLKDPASMKLLSDQKFVQQLKDPALAAALSNPELAAALRPYGPTGCTNGCGMLQNPEFLKALQDPAVAAALQKPDIKAAFNDPALAAALRNPEMSAALARYGPNWSTCTNGTACPSPLHDAQFLAALQNPAFARALQNSQVMAALQNPAFDAALLDTRLSAALQSQAFQQALTSGGFFAALRDSRFAAAIASH
jgi:hypothetical protein